MDTRESTTAWVIAGILLVLLVIVGYLWLSTPKDIDTVLSEGYDSLVAQREELRIACQSPEGSQEACDRELRDLSNLLAEFSADIDAATSSAEVNASATTTAE